MTGFHGLRFGILGVGRIGALHADLLHNRVRRATVSGVFDVAQDQAAQVGREIKCRVHASAHELITSDDVDAVVIATSTDTHVELIVEAAAAGKAIFCEKPISLSLAGVDRALAAVDAAGVALHIGFNRRFDPGHRAVRDAVLEGTLGDLRQIRITSRDPAPPPIEYVQASGGIFCDMTIHDFDMARFVSGSEVVEVYATGGVRIDPAIGDVGDIDTAVVVLTHADGTLTTIDNCREAVYGYDQRVEAFGSGGVTSSQNHLDHYAVTRTAEGGSTAAVPYFFIERYVPSYLAQWEAFVTAVLGGEPPPVGGVEGRAPLVIGLAAKRSVEEHRPVAIDEIV